MNHDVHVLLQQLVAESNELVTRRRADWLDIWEEENHINPKVKPATPREEHDELPEMLEYEEHEVIAYELCDNAEGSIGRSDGFSTLENPV